jgi:acetyl-CoA/propionyl-CoA carboxylase, biotin carboxylase, biotin carboxyl carrier protein
LSEVPSAYDSLVAKLVTWGSDRDEARRRMLRALDEYVVEGVDTSIPAHRLLLLESSFVEGTHTTRTVEDSGVLDPLTQHPEQPHEQETVLLVGGHPVRLWNPAMAPWAAAAVRATAPGGDVVAPMQGTILEVLVDTGQGVRAGQPLLVFETMKMEATISAPTSGIVTKLRVGAGEVVGSGQVLAVIEG